MKHHKNYSIFEKEKIVAAVAILAMILVAGIAIGASLCHADDEMITCYVLCKPIEGEYVHVRQRASTRSAEVGRLDCGDSFKTDGTSKNGFLHVLGIGEYGEGWIYVGYVSTEEPELIFEQYVCVSNYRVACRRWQGGPQVDDRPWLKNGSNVYVYCTADGWAVTNRGYIKFEFLEVDPE